MFGFLLFCVFFVAIDCLSEENKSEFH